MEIDPTKANEEFRLSLTHDLNEFLKEQGFDTTGSSIWEIYCWSGRAWESNLTSIICHTYSAEWGISPMAGSGVASCRIPFEYPLEEVVKALRRVPPGPVEWEDVAGMGRRVKSGGPGEPPGGSPS